MENNIKTNCANDWWNNKLNSSGRVLLVEKHYPWLFHILNDVMLAVTEEMIISMYEDETKI